VFEEMGGNPSVWLVLRAELSREVLRDEVPARGMTHADGGVYAKVQAVEHLSPNGKVVSFNFGSCEPPQD